MSSASNPNKPPLVMEGWGDPADRPVSPAGLPVGYRWFDVPSAPSRVAWEVFPGATQNDRVWVEQQALADLIPGAVVIGAPDGSPTQDPTITINSTTHELTLPVAPVAPTDAANKAYVDAAVSVASNSQDWKDSVRAATTAALPAYTATATRLTASANGAFPAVDTIAIVVGQDILVKNETGGNAQNNGPMTLVDAGSAGTPWILDRRADANTSAKVTGGMVLSVVEGSPAPAGNRNTQWALTTKDPIVLGTTLLTFLRVVSISPILAENGDVIANVNSATGSDTTGDGTAALPFATWSAARNAISIAIAPTGGPTGKCRIRCAGAGPYALPQYIEGVIPQGTGGEPLITEGDVYAVLVPLGTVTAAATPSVTTDLTATLDQYRGKQIHVLSGTGVGQYGQIATNTAAVGAAVFTDNGNAKFGMVAGSTFEIIQPQTVFTTIIQTAFGVGFQGWWRCKFSAASLAYITAGLVQFDACEMLFAASQLFVLEEANVYFCRFFSGNRFFTRITDIGTLLGTSGLTYSALATNPMIGSGAPSFVTGQLVTNSRIDLIGNSTWQLSGMDVLYAPTTGASQVGVNLDKVSSFRQTGYGRIAVTGAVGLGAQVVSNSSLDLTNTVITGGTFAGVSLAWDAWARMSGVSGSTGNLVGVSIATGARLFVQTACTITGSSGDVQRDLCAPVTWAKAGFFPRSGDGQAGSNLAWAGGFLGAAGAVTFFFPMGGLPGSVAGVNNQLTTIGTPITPGRLLQQLYVNVLANALATSAVFTIYKNGVATAVTVTFAAGVTGVASDTTHSVTFNDGDRIDLVCTNTAGVNPNAITFSAACRAN